MRLIDADALKKHVGSYAGMFTDEGFMVDFQAVLNGIDFQPTAYDIDKVMEQLEKAKDEFSGGTLQEEYYWRGINKAIEIVKKGGVADEKGKD